MHFTKNQTSESTKIVERNVSVLLQRRQEESEKRNLQEKVVDSVTGFTSTMLSFYIHFLFFGTWVTWNLGWLHLKPFDGTFMFLAAFAGVEAIFLTTFVLIGQRRMKIQADKSAELDLQVSLLTEHEVTKIMTLVTAIARKMEIQEANNKEIEELSKDIRPENVLDTMEQAGN